MNQGVGANQIIGYRGNWKGHFHRIALAVGTTPCFVRVIHFLWRQADLSAYNTGNLDGPSLNCILQNSPSISTPGPFVNTQYTFLSPYNLQWAKQYKILHDEIYALSTVGHTQVHINKKKLALSASFRVLYATDEESLPSNANNTLTGMIPYVMFLTSVNTVAAQPSITYYSRLKYTNF